MTCLGGRTENGEGTHDGRTLDPLLAGGAFHYHMRTVSEKKGPKLKRYYIIKNNENVCK